MLNAKSWTIVFVFAFAGMAATAIAILAGIAYAAYWCVKHLVIV